MIAKQLISEAIIPLKTSDTGIIALSMMEEYKVSHLPIVNNVDFLGLISETDIFEYNKPDEALGAYHLSIIGGSVFENQHIYDAIRLIAEYKLTLIPVLDIKNKYLGCITLTELAQNFAKIASLNNPGGIIVLEVNSNDYLLTQIAQIVESNDAKILSLYEYSPLDSTKMEIIIKINKIDIRSIIQTFTRYNYMIKETYAESSNDDELMDRYDAFMNYLNI